VTTEEVDQACQSSSESAGGLYEPICHLEVRFVFIVRRTMMLCSHDPLSHPGSIFSLNEMLSSYKDELNQGCGDSTTQAKCLQRCAAATGCFAASVQYKCATTSRNISCNEISCM
jgi:hypothetical protein